LRWRDQKSFQESFCCRRERERKRDGRRKEKERDMWIQRVNEEIRKTKELRVVWTKTNK